MKNRQDKPLKDHVQNKKKFIPPFIHRIPGMSFVNWLDDILPEIIWIQFILNKFGDREGIGLLAGFSKFLSEITEKYNVEEEASGREFKYPHFSLLSNYKKIPEELEEDIRAKFKSSFYYERFLCALTPLIFLYPEIPIRKLFDISDVDYSSHGDSFLKQVKLTVAELLNRRDKKAMILQTTAVYIEGVSGALKIVRGSGLEKIEDIFDYPETEDSRHIASSVRAFVSTMGGMMPGIDRSWRLYFWQRGFSISDCDIVGEELIPDKQVAEDPHEEAKNNSGPQIDNYDEAVILYQNRVQQLITESLREKTNLNESDKYDVLSGLISRQYRFVTAVLNGHNLATVDLGQLLIRSMTDTHILLAWFFRCGKLEDYRRFIDYGLGQEKLFLEHLRANKKDGDSEVEKIITSIHSWIEGQKREMFLTVNVGTWADKDTRILAKEARLEKTYNSLYLPGSAMVHGSWNSIAKYNLRTCLNPLHKLHKLPDFEPVPHSVHIIATALDLFDMSFDFWAKSLGVSKSSESIQGEFWNIIQKNKSNQE